MKCNVEAKIIYLTSDHNLPRLKKFILFYGKIWEFVECDEGTLIYGTCALC